VILCTELVLFFLPPVDGDSEGESLRGYGLIIAESGTIGDPSLEETRSTVGKESSVEDVRSMD
jgi:hypothetical protein